jgi:DNA-binding transcriptional LysR family regulator
LLAAKAAGILEGARRLKEDVAGEPEVPRGPVRVGAGEAAIVYFLLPLLRRIREAYPSLALEVRNQRDMESFDQLLASELDLAVRSREALPHGLRFEPLFASDRMLIVPRGHELAGKKRPTLRDLARHAFVIPPAGSTSRRLIEAAFLRASLRLEIAMEAGWMSMGW